VLRRPRQVLVTIDVTDVEGAHELTGMRGHGYWFANQRVSSDVLLSMVYPFDPTWRGLVHGPGPGLWPPRRPPAACRRRGVSGGAPASPRHEERAIVL